MLYIYPPPVTADYDHIFQLSVAVHFYQCVTKEINYWATFAQVAAHHAVCTDCTYDRYLFHTFNHGCRDFTWTKYSKILKKKYLKLNLFKYSKNTHLTVPRWTFFSAWRQTGKITEPFSLEKAFKIIQSNHKARYKDLLKPPHKIALCFFMKLILLA